MKKFLLLTLIGISSLFAFPKNATAAVAQKTANHTSVSPATTATKKQWKDLSRKEKRAHKKSLRKTIKAQIKAAKKSGDTNTLLLVIVAILIPFLAMGIYDGITNRFWISLLLTLLFYLPGLIYTLVIILGEK